MESRRSEEPTHRGRDSGPHGGAADPITRRSHTVVVISAAGYEELTGKRPSFKEFLSRGESFQGFDSLDDWLIETEAPYVVEVVERPPG